MIQQKKVATSVNKCDNEKQWPIPGLKQLNICRQCILKEKKSLIAKQTETSFDQNNIWDKYFWMIQQKNAPSVDKCDNGKNGPSLVCNNCNIVDNVF